MKTNDIAVTLKKNVVTLFFVVLCFFTTLCSGQSFQFILQELVTRLCRNSVLILALLMPVQCGMGLNFSIVLGAAAGEIGLIIITSLGISGFIGMIICLLIGTVLSVIFGFFAGALFNKTVGQEMITGMIVGYFAKGVFDLFFLILAGTFIFPISNPTLLLAGGIGLKNTIQLNNGVRYVFDNVIKANFLDCLIIGLSLWIIYSIVFYLLERKRTSFDKTKTLSIMMPKIIVAIIILVALLLFIFVPVLNKAGLRTKVPLFTVVLIVLVCLFNMFIMRTKLGQDIRTCGQDMHVASASGIKVGKTRIIATIISTVVASWGQIIFLQNMGLINTYTSYEQVGTYAIAALLVGGATISRATIKQVFIGAALFHLLFFTMPLAGNNLFNDSQIGEYFRVFVSYGVIAVALALHAWENVSTKRKKKMLIAK